jgi:hypothetical protein
MEGGASPVSATASSLITTASPRREPAESGLAGNMLKDVPARAICVDLRGVHGASMPQSIQIVTERCAIVL